MENIFTTENGNKKGKTISFTAENWKKKSNVKQSLLPQKMGINRKWKTISFTTENWKKKENVKQSRLPQKTGTSNWNRILVVPALENNRYINS